MKTEKQELVQLPQEVMQIAENVSAEKRNEVQSVLNHVFNGVAKMREQLDGVNVTDVDDKVNMKLANTIRLGVRQVRLDAEKTFDSKRSEVQQQMLSYKTEDSLWLKAKQTMQILTKEIEEQARWKEETKKRFEEEQKELKAQQRMLKVAKVAPEMARNEFENMSDETFDIFFAGIEKAFNDRIAAEKQAEAERIAKEKAEAEERERIRLENIRLQKEAEEREYQMKKEREVAEKALAEERAKAEAERKEADAKAAKERAEIEAKERESREAAEKALAELNAKKEAEEKAFADAESARIKASKAPIKLKLNTWVDSFSLPEIDVDNPTTNVINEKFNAFKVWAKNQVETV